MTDYFEHKLDPPGVRPDWLADGEEIKCKWSDSGDRFYGPFLAQCIANWHLALAIRIPPDHWAVPALERGFKPWPGGESAPSDWDGGEVLYGDLSACQPDKADIFWMRDEPLDDAEIIGYRPKPTASEHPEYSPELVERAFKVVEWFAENGGQMHGNYELWKDSQAILSELNKSKEVDPLVEAFDAIHGVQCAEGETWSGKMTRTLRAELDKRGYAITRKDEAA